MVTNTSIILFLHKNFRISRVPDEIKFEVKPRKILHGLQGFASLGLCSSWWPWPHRLLSMI